MLLFMKRISLIFAVLAMSACSTTNTPNFNHLDAGARPHIQTVDTVLVAKQKRLGADVKEGSKVAKILAVTQANVLPLLVDAGVTGIRTFTAHKLSAPMREALGDYDYPVEFKEQILTSLSTSAVDGIDQIKIRRKEFDGFRGGFIQTSSADAVMFIDMRYGFTQDFGKLYVALSATMFPNKDELTPFQEEEGNDNVIEYTDNIYRNQFVAIISPDDKAAGQSGKYVNSIYWAGLSEEELKVRLEKAGLLLAETLANDLGIDDVTNLPDAGAADDKSIDIIKLEKEDLTSTRPDEGVADDVEINDLESKEGDNIDKNAAAEMPLQSAETRPVTATES